MPRDARQFGSRTSTELPPGFCPAFLQGPGWPPSDPKFTVPGRAPDHSQTRVLLSSPLPNTAFGLQRQSWEPGLWRVLGGGGKKEEGFLVCPPSTHTASPALSCHGLDQQWEVSSLEQSLGLDTFPGPSHSSPRQSLSYSTAGCLVQKAGCWTWVCRDHLPLCPCGLGTPTPAQTGGGSRAQVWPASQVLLAHSDWLGVAHLLANENQGKHFLRSQRGGAPEAISRQQMLHPLWFRPL